MMAGFMGEGIGEARDGNAAVPCKSPIKADAAALLFHERLSIYGVAVPGEVIGNARKAPSTARQKFLGTLPKPGRTRHQVEKIRRGVDNHSPVLACVKTVASITTER